MIISVQFFIERRKLLWYFSSTCIFSTIGFSRPIFYWDKLISKFSKVFDKATCVVLSRGNEAQTIVLAVTWLVDVVACDGLIGQWKSRRTCNPFNCRGGFSLHVSTKTRNEFQIFPRSNAESSILRVIIRWKRVTALCTQRRNFLTSLYREKCQWFSLEVAGHRVVGNAEHLCVTSHDLVTFENSTAKEQIFNFLTCICERMTERWVGGLVWAAV